MVAATQSAQASSYSEHLGERFLAILPKIRRHAQIYFRHISCMSQRDDKVAETIALAWRWFVRLAEQGKDASQFPVAFATLIARSVRCGRRLAGNEKAKDVLSAVAQRRHGVVVERLDHSMRSDHLIREALADNTVTSPSEQAAFRIDFPEWRARYARREREMVDDLMMGERTKEVSKKYGLTAGRISQKRRRFHQDWLRMHGELVSSCQRDGAA